MGLRSHYTAELEQLRLQVEVMTVRVEENLDRMRAALAVEPNGFESQAARVDDEVDAMNVSLTERCYEILALQTPVASDLRLVVSVVRVLNDLERISDHAVRICRDASDGLPDDEPQALYDLLLTLADETIDRFHTARRAWGAMDLDLAVSLANGSPLAEALHQRLVRELVQLHGPHAVEVALRAASIARSLERICDHTTIIGARLRYLITGDPAHLAAEIR